jgi:hypothetical protein
VNRISRKQKKWLRGLMDGNALAVPLFMDATMGGVRMSKDAWRQNLLIWRQPSLAIFRFVRNPRHAALPQGGPFGGGQS